jgi:hypothetical protein
MTATLHPACPLCGLRFGSRPLLDLHIREDHRQYDPGDARIPMPRSGTASDLPTPARLRGLHQLGPRAEAPPAAPGDRASSAGPGDRNPPAGPGDRGRQPG